MVILKILGIIILLIFISMVYSIIKNRKSLKITNYIIEDSEIPKSFNNYKILQLSDLHTYEFGKNNKNLIEKISNENPDIIVMTGDMLDCLSKKADVLYRLVESLIKKYKIYYIVGNHEERYKTKKLEKIKMNLKKLGVVVLNNEKAIIEKDNQKINIYGMVLKLKYYFSKKEKKVKNINLTVTGMNKILGKINDNEYNVLLVHSPIYFDTYALWGANLILSGHMHGGIINIPKIGGVLSPERTFFPKYSGGIYIKKINNKSSNLIVSKGLGFGRIPYRIFNPPEIVTISLKNNIKK